VSGAIWLRDICFLLTQIEANRLHILMRQHQSERCQLNWLIGRLETRFTEPPR
jgi:hypothetical protein